jgi:hypothetical protein
VDYALEKLKGKSISKVPLDNFHIKVAMELRMEYYGLI